MIFRQYRDSKVGMVLAWPAYDLGWFPVPHKTNTVPPGVISVSTTVCAYAKQSKLKKQ